MTQGEAREKIEKALAATQTLITVGVECRFDNANGVAEFTRHDAGLIREALSAGLEFVKQQEQLSDDWIKLAAAHCYGYSQDCPAQDFESIIRGYYLAARHCQKDASAIEDVARRFKPDPNPNSTLNAALRAACESFGGTDAIAGDVTDEERKFLNAIRQNTDNGFETFCGQTARLLDISCRLESIIATLREEKEMYRTAMQNRADAVAALSNQKAEFQQQLSREQAELEATKQELADWHKRYWHLADTVEQDGPRWEQLKRELEQAQSKLRSLSTLPDKMKEVESNSTSSEFRKGYRAGRDFAAELVTQMLAGKEGAELK